jgi:hypothetical protein
MEGNMLSIKVLGYFTFSHMLYNENTAIVKNNNLEILVEEYKISQIATETSLKRQISK